MVKWLPVALMASVLLTSGEAYLYIEGGPSNQRPPIQVAQRSDALEQCLHAAQMVFDVHWAVACATQVDGDDGAECDLAPHKAARVNAWLNEAERQCMAEARASRR